MAKKFDAMFGRYTRQYWRVTDGRTDGHLATAYSALMHSIARQKYERSAEQNWSSSTIRDQ